jgi:hypothetical protein
VEFSPECSGLSRLAAFGKAYLVPCIQAKLVQVAAIRYDLLSERVANE